MRDTVRLYKEADPEDIAVMPTYDNVIAESCCVPWVPAVLAICFTIFMVVCYLLYICSRDALCDGTQYAGYVTVLTVLFAIATAVLARVYISARCDCCGA